MRKKEEKKGKSSKYIHGYCNLHILPLTRSSWDCSVKQNWEWHAVKFWFLDIILESTWFKKSSTCSAPISSSQSTLNSSQSQNATTIKSQIGQLVCVCYLLYYSLI